jgi:hypothetical protein
LSTPVMRSQRACAAGEAEKEQPSEFAPGTMRNFL